MVVKIFLIVSAGLITFHSHAQTTMSEQKVVDSPAVIEVKSDSEFPDTGDKTALSRNQIEKELLEKCVIVEGSEACVVFTSDRKMYLLYTATKKLTDLRGRWYFYGNHFCTNPPGDIRKRCSVIYKTENGKYFIEKQSGAGKLVSIEMFAFDSLLEEQPK